MLERMSPTKWARRQLGEVPEAVTTSSHSCYFIFTSVVSGWSDFLLSFSLCLLGSHDCPHEHRLSSKFSCHSLSCSAVS